MSGHNQQDLSDLERALTSLAPAAAPLERDRLMFEAGRRAAPRRRWLWPASSAFMTAVAACLGMVLLLRPPPAPETNVVYVNRPATAPAPPPPEPQLPEPVPSPVPFAGSSVWQLQQIGVRHGIDEVPEPAVRSARSSGSVLAAWDWRPRADAAISLFQSGVE